MDKYYFTGQLSEAIVPTSDKKSIRLSSLATDTVASSLSIQELSVTRRVMISLIVCTLPPSHLFSDSSARLKYRRFSQVEKKAYALPRPISSRQH